jgi:hypothetical protein
MKTKIFLTILLAIISLSMLILATSCNSEINVQVKETGSFTDTRDGRIYKTIKIGEQWLMSENLAYKPEQGNYWAYDDDTANGCTQRLAPTYRIRLDKIEKIVRW